MLRIESRHGYFVFEEDKSGEMSNFMDRYGIEIERDGPLFTFADLVGAPDFSLVGGTFLGCPTTVAFEGDPWEVMRENNLVYNVAIGLVVPMLTITDRVSLIEVGNFYLADGMIQPGSITDGGLRVTDYSAFFSWDRLDFKYSEVDSE